MLCYPLYFGASIHSAVHHRFCLKTCIKLKQQNLYCHLIGYCHFPGVYLPRTTAIVSSHHLCLHIWEVPKALPKARCRKLCGKAAQGSLPGVPCHTPGVGNEALNGSAKPSFSSPAKCHTACSIYPAHIPIMKVSFPQLTERTDCISWAGFAAALGLSFTPMESAPNQEACFAQI